MQKLFNWIKISIVYIGILNKALTEISLVKTDFIEP